MNKIEDNLNSIVDGEFISEEKTESVFGTTRARASVVQSLFECEVTKEFNVSNLENLYYYKKLNKSKKKMALQLLDYAIKNRSEIDKKINKHIKNHKIERVAKTDLSILRMAVSEISSDIETPIGVIVNEAVKLADVFGSDTSKNFINGVLSSMVR